LLASVVLWGVVAETTTGAILLGITTAGTGLIVGGIVAGVIVIAKSNWARNEVINSTKDKIMKELKN
jgi:hypothetical protein